MDGKKIINHQEHLKRLVDRSAHSFSDIKNLIDYLIIQRESS